MAEYQALYRKYRPRSFDDVVGQEHITETLKRQVSQGRVSHAYIFVGTRGTGKTTCAKILSRAVNCENPVNGNPCNCCRSCLGIEDGSVLDVEELDAASNNGVDNIRALRDEAVYSPSEVRKRVYIVDEVHMLSTAAFNALLKILEEPPEHLIFILATTEIKKVPTTILSRCQRFQFRRISDEAMQKRLAYVAAQEGLDLTQDAAVLLSRLADGALRDGLSLLDQCAWPGKIDIERVNSTVGLVGTEATAELMRAVAAADAQSALEISDRMWRNGKELSAVLGELSGLMRDALILRVAKGQRSPLISGMYDFALVEETAQAFTSARLISCISDMENSAVEMLRGTGRRVTAELCLIRMCRAEFSSDTSALVSRLEALESALKNGAPVPAARSVREAAVPAPSAPTPPSAPAAHDAPPWDAEPPKPAPKPEAPAPAEKSAAKPAPTHTEEPAAKPEQTVSGDSDPLWPQIFEAAKLKLGRMTRIYLSNPANFSARLEGSRLELGIFDQVTLSYVDRDETRDALAEAVTQVTGKPAVVIMQKSEPQVKKRSVDDLDRLIKLKGLG